jgi:hypothetical protein
MKLKEDFSGHLGGILVPFFGLRFSVDFSPLFGLRAFGKLLVLLCFSSFEVDLGPVFGLLLDRTFHQRCHLSGLHEAGFQVSVFGVLGVHYS